MNYIYPLKGDPQVAYPLAWGTYPSRPGEALVSEALADLLSLKPGSTLEIEVPAGGRVELRVVGASISRNNNGYYVVVADESIFTGAPGKTGASLYLDVSGIDPSEALDEVRRSIVSSGYVVPEYAATKYQIADTIREFSSVLEGIYYGISFIAALAAGIALAGMMLVDASSRAREQAALIALGVSPRRLTAVQVVQALIALAAAAPLAYAAGLAVAKATARQAALALGYIEPLASPGSLATPLMASAAATALAVGAASLLFYYARLNLPGILRE